MTVHLRAWAAGDTPALVDVFVAAFQRGYPEVLPPDVLAGVDAPTVSGWFARWTAELTTVVAETDGGAAVGFVRFGDDAGAGAAAGAGAGAGAGGERAGGERAGGERAGATGSDGGRVGYVAALYVHPDSAGRGVGRMLLEHAVAALAAQGAIAVTLWVFRDNARARALYTAVGFAPDGAEVTDPEWRVPQIRMRRELRAP